MMKLRTRHLTSARIFQAHKALLRFSSSSTFRSRFPARTSLLPPCFSLLTLPNDTKHDILQVLRQGTIRRKHYPNRQHSAPQYPFANHPFPEHQLAQHPFAQLQVPAAVVLASPRHASWLSDVDFMAEVVRELRRMSRTEQAILTKFHLLTAVVDGLPAITPDGVPQEGLSFATGYADRLLPGLWSDTHQSLSDTVASSLGFVTEVRNTHAPKVGPRPRSIDISVTLPLANTLFLTGRRTTLLVSEWDIAYGRPQYQQKIERSRTAEKRNQTVSLPPGRLSIECRLHNITPPRILADVLGNIVSKIEIEGNPSPASEDLQREIPIWLQDRDKQLPREKTPGPVAVWALVTPRQYVLDLMNSDEIQESNEIQDNKGTSASNEQVLSRYKALSDGVSVGALVRRSCRLVRVLSGGGEWGAKAGLLSLDPQIEYDSPSEAESLESFQSSFQGDVKAAGAIAKPGDIIQFFVEPAPEDTDDHGAFPSEDLVLFSTKLGVSDGIQDPELQEKQLLQHRTKTAPFPSLPFGGYSSEGIYLSVPHTNRKTKIDVPGSYIISGRFKAGDGNLMVKAPVKEGLFIGPRRVQSEMRVDTRAKATWREWDRGWDLRW